MGGNSQGIVAQVLKYSQFLKDQFIVASGVGQAAMTTLRSAVDTKRDLGGGNTLESIFKNAQESAVGEDGAMQAAQQSTVPTTLLDLGKKALNPYTTFGDASNRSTLLDYLIQQLQPKVGNPLLLDQIKILKSHYSAQDSALSATEEAARTGFLDKIDQTYPQANKALLLLTNGQFGMLPDRNKLNQMISLRTSKQEVDEQQKADATNLARGGVVYASNGALINYQPRGTDTVPAMLTPGEFVVNRSSTQANLPLLKAINSGGAKGMSYGGIVDYFNKGGIITPKYYADGVAGVTAANISGGASVQLDVGQAGQQLISTINTGFSNAAQTLQNTLQTFGFDTNQLTAINGFINGLKSVTDALSSINITPEVKFTGQVDVNVNGVQGMTSSMQVVVDEAIKKALTGLKQDNSSLEIDPSSSKYYNK